MTDLFNYPVKMPHWETSPGEGLNPKMRLVGKPSRELCGKLAENGVRCQATSREKTKSAVSPEIALAEEGYEEAIKDFVPKQKNLCILARHADGGAVGHHVGHSGGFFQYLQRLQSDAERDAGYAPI